MKTATTVPSYALHTAGIASQACHRNPLPGCLAFQLMGLMRQRYSGDILVQCFLSFHRAHGGLVKSDAFRDVCAVLSVYGSAKVTLHHVTAAQQPMAAASAAIPQTSADTTALPHTVHIVDDGTVTGIGLRWFMSTVKAATVVTPLHHAARYNRVRATFMLLAAVPNLRRSDALEGDGPLDAVQCQDDRGFIPLHTAIVFSFISIIRMLLQAWPMSVRCTNDEVTCVMLAALRGCTPFFRVFPLHYDDAALRAYQQESILILQLLLDMWPEGIRYIGTGEHRVTVFHIAVCNQPPIDDLPVLDGWRQSLHDRPGDLSTLNTLSQTRVQLLRLLCAMWPEGLQVWDADGETPLHAAAAYPPYDTAVFAALIDAWPGGVRAVNRKGNTPVQEAHRAAADMWLQEQAYPENIDAVMDMLSATDQS